MNAELLGCTIVIMAEKRPIALAMINIESSIIFNNNYSFNKKIIDEFSKIKNR